MSRAPIHSKFLTRPQSRPQPDVSNEARQAFALVQEAAPVPGFAAPIGDGIIRIDNRSLAGDVIDYIPAQAAAKLRAIRDALDDARAVSNKAAENWQEAHARKNEAAANVLKLTDRAAASRYGISMLLPSDDPVVIAAKTALDHATAELAHATDLRDARNFRVGQIMPAVRNSENYLKAMRGKPLTEHGPVEVDLKKNETITSALERARKQIASLGADLQTIRSAPHPSSVVKARARSQIQSMATAGRPDVFAAIEIGESIKWPHTDHAADAILTAYGIMDPMRVDGSISTRLPSTFAVMAWLMKDRLIESVEAEIDACADDSHALTDADRAKKLSATLDEILEVERQEEALIEMAATQGQEIARRPECDPRAVLGIVGPQPKADY